MTTFDLVIVGGTIVTASDTFNADIGINNGQIAVIADRLEGGQHTINAEGRYVFPLPYRTRIKYGNNGC